MNRHQRRAAAKEQRDYVAQKAYHDKPVSIPRDEWPAFNWQGHEPVMIWISNKYHVQLYEEYTAEYPDMKRLSVCRVKVGTDMRWRDGLTWDELQAIKRELGYGDWYAVEVYPRDADLINVANFRHLWLFETPLNIGWRSHV